MKRPLVGMAIALALGIFSGANANIPLRWLLGLAAISAGIAGVLLLRPKWKLWCFAATLASIVACGAAYASARSADSTGRGLALLLNSEPRIFRVQGTIDGLPETRFPPDRDESDDHEAYTQLDLRVRTVRIEQQWVPVRGRLRVFCDGEAPHLSHGDALDVALRAWRAPPPANPGQFDYAVYLERAGINGLADVGLAEALQPLDQGASWSGVKWVWRVKQRVARAIENPQRVAPAQAAILKCLILGDRNALDPAQQNHFRETGTIHFLAISGLHVGIIALFCWWILLLCRVRHRPAALIVLGIVLVYAVLSGFRPSVQRASVMCAVVCGGFILGRKPNLATSLSLAAIVILLIEPAELFSAGFQLSFAAVVGICVFALPIERMIFGLPDDLDRLVPPEEREWLRHPIRWVFQKTISVSLAAWVVTLPLTIHHFGMMSPMAPLATLLLLPAVWLALVTGLPGVLLAPLLGGYVQPLLTTAAFGARVMEWISSQLARVSGVVLYLPPAGWGFVALCGAVMIAAAYRKQLRLNRMRLAALTLAVALVYAGFVWPQKSPQHLTMHVAATGSGNCVIVRFPSGKTLLFDAGGGGRSEVGERIIAPALWSLGVRRIDLAVLSHADADHCNGFLDVARRIPVGRLALPEKFARHKNAKEFLKQLEAIGLDPVTVAAGDRISGIPDAEIDLLWPPRNLAIPKQLSENEYSAVVRIRSPEGSILLTGDFGERATPILLNGNPDLHADILQVPHHGRPDYSAPRFAQAVMPKVAVIPGGRSAETPSPYAPYSGRLLATDDCGMISIELKKGQSPRIETFLNSR